MANKFKMMGLGNTLRDHWYFNDTMIMARFESLNNDDEFMFTTIRLSKDCVIALKTPQFYNTTEKLPYTFYIWHDGTLLAKHYDKIESAIWFLWANHEISNEVIDDKAYDLVRDKLDELKTYCDFDDNDLEIILRYLFKVGAVTPYYYGEESEVINDLLNKALNDF